MFLPFHGQRSTILGLTKGTKPLKRDKITVLLAILQINLLQFLYEVPLLQSPRKKVRVFCPQILRETYFAYWNRKESFC